VEKGRVWPLIAHLSDVQITSYGQTGQARDSDETEAAAMALFFHSSIKSGGLAGTIYYSG
jgi:hypothetical protein